MKRLKILMTTWHVMHYHDLCNALKDYADFYLVPNISRDWRDDRFLQARALPENVFFVPFFEEGVYDFAILGIDQQCANQDLGKSRVFRELNKNITCPKVVINHGSPIYPEYFKYEQMTDDDAKKACIEVIKEMIGDNLMVTNSYDVATQERGWGWGHPIWHGMDVDEWYDLPKEPKVSTALSPGGLDFYYNRMCMNELMRELEMETGYIVQWARMTQYAKTDASPTAYKDFLGRSLIYVDTSIETPMNRGRTEAMLSGACIVQVEGALDLDHDVGDGTKLRDYMVIVPNNPREISKRISELLNDPKGTMAIGKKGQEMARRVFNRERYKQDWLKLIREQLHIAV